MEEIKPTPRTIVNRMRKRASYDRGVVHAILDRSLVCHVGVVIDGAPRVLPTCMHAWVIGLSSTAPQQSMLKPRPRASRSA